jgi:hypothetical protein
MHGEKINLYFFFFAFARNLTAENPKEAQRAAKFFGVTGEKIEVFLCLRCAFASSAALREKLVVRTEDQDKQRNR